MIHSNSALIVQSDALDYVRGLDANSVDLVASDPPYNTGLDWGDYDDRWTKARANFSVNIRTLGIAKGWVELAEQISGEEMAAYMCYMGNVFWAAKRVLKPRGNIVIQCDYRAVF